jgi:glycosyltransferase involved in cell wall biosynthesis
VVSGARRQAPADSVPEVSVVLCVRNGGALLDEQLQALSRQDIDTTWELVVVDNGSTDDSVRRVERAAHLFPRLVVVDAPERASLSYARNVGTDAARGAVVAYCDADDVVHPDWLGKLCRATGPGTIAGGALAYEALNDPLSRFWRGLDAMMADLPSWFGDLRAVMGANFAVTRQDFDRLGGFDPIFTGSSDEVDFCYRAYQAGMKVVFVADAVVEYRLRATIRQAARQQRGYGRSNALLYRKHRACMTAPSLRTTIATYWELLRCVHHLVRGRALRGRWLCHAGYRAGRIAGSVDARVWFV